MQVFVEELVRVNREINKNPMSIVEERKKLGLLKDLGEARGGLPTYFKEGVAGGIFPTTAARERGQDRPGVLRAFGLDQEENPRSTTTGTSPPSRRLCPG